MSDRRLPSSKDAGVSLLRDLLDRVERLEKGSNLLGLVSFGPAIRVGDVLITIVNGVGNDRKVQFKNVITGSTSVIDLP